MLRYKIENNLMSPAMKVPLIHGDIATYDFGDEKFDMVSC